MGTLIWMLGFVACMIWSVLEVRKDEDFKRTVKERTRRGDPVGAAQAILWTGITIICLLWPITIWFVIGKYIYQKVTA